MILLFNLLRYADVVTPMQDIQVRLNGLESEQRKQEENEISEEHKREKFNLLRKQHYQLKRHSIHSNEDDDLQQDRCGVEVKGCDERKEIEDDNNESNEDYISSNNSFMDI